MTDQGVQVRGVLALTVVTWVVGWALLTAWRAGGRGLPDPGWALAVPVLLITVLVGALGWNVRSYLRGAFDTRPLSRPSPQRARATLGAAQAAALGGAVLVGAFLALLMTRLPDVDVPTVRDDAVRFGVLALLSALPVVAGLVVQSWCRLPPPEDE